MADAPIDAPAKPQAPELARRPLTYRGLFLCQFTATFLAVLSAGAVLAVGVRAYLRWSVKDEVQKYNDPSQMKPDSGPLHFDPFPEPKGFKFDPPGK